MNSRRIGIFLSTVAAVALFTGRAPSDTFTYSSARRQVRVGILTSEALRQGNLGSVNPDPYVFYVLDSRQDLKPLGYEFLNPLAPSVITPEIYKRWLDRLKGGSNDPAFTAGTPESQVFKVGAKVTKNMGAYWEVNLDGVSVEELRQYDVLYLHTQKVNPPIAFTSDAREKLRRFVDSGGLLWVDGNGAMQFKERIGPVDREAPFLFDSQFVLGGNGTAVIATPNHSLLTYPFLITQQEAQSLGLVQVGNGGGFIAHVDTRFGGTGRVDNTVQVPGGQTLIPLIWNTRGFPPAGPITPNVEWRANVLVGQVGAGRLVMSCQDIGGGINDFAGGYSAGYGPNSGALAGEFMQGARPIDMKFAYNLVSWTGAQTTANSDVRRTGANDERIGAVLDTKWVGPGSAGSFKVSGASYFRNCVFSVDGNLILHCYDARPGQDLDGDGNSDDGIVDYIGGSSEDRIWSHPLRTGSAADGASAPTVFEFYDANYISRPGAPAGFANFNLREMVVVVLSDGSIVAVRAFPRRSEPQLRLATATVEEWRIPSAALGLIPYQISNAPSGGANPDPNPDLPIPAAAWSEGTLFAAVNTANGGRVLAIDPRAGRSALMPGPFGTSVPTSELSAVPDLPGMPTVMSSPTVGYVRDNATGAIDKVVYVNTANTATSVASVRAFWFGTRGEPLARINDTTWQSRADRPWFAPDPAAPGDANMELRPRLYHTFRDPGGAYITQEFEYIGAGPPPGANQFGVEFNNNAMRVLLPAAITVPVFGAVPTGDERHQFRVDYTLDWRVDPAKAVNQRVNARTTFLVPDVAASPNPPDQPGGPSKLGGAPALTGDDLLAYTVTTGKVGSGPNPGNGVLFAANEQHLRTRLRWAFTMHDGFTMPINGAPVTVPPRLRQLDPTLPGYYQNFITSVQLSGTPAYKDGVLYAVGRGEIGVPGGGGPMVSVLCAFRANPLIRLRLNQRVDPGTPIRIRQVNVVKSQSLANSFNPAAASNPLWVDLNPTQYTINWDSGEITINSSSPTGTLENFVSTSLPFVVRVGNGPEQVISGQTIDLNLANTTERQPRMIGPTGADNLLWYVAIPANFNLSFNGATLPNPGFVSSSPAIMGTTIWLGTQNGFLLSFDTDPSARDPQFQANGAQLFLSSPPIAGLNRPGALRHAEQVSVGAPGALAAIIGSPAGTANLMMVNTYQGVQTLEDAHTVIADSKRIIEVNAAGDAVWSSDSSKTYGVAGGELPQYVFDPATGDVTLTNAARATGLPVALNVPYSRPTVARRVGMNDLLIVDTGNNRVVQIDRGGNVVWEVHRLFNDLGLLRPGDPLTLNEPTDVQFWTEYVPANSRMFNGVQVDFPNAYVVHYLISDTGNFRVIELVDMYDVNGQPITPVVAGNPATFQMLRQTWFVSSSYALLSKRYRYRSVQRMLLQNSDLPPAWQDPALPVRQLTLTAIANARLSGTGNVGVNVGGDLVESGGGSLVVLNEQGNPLSIVSNLRLPDGAGGFRIQPIVNPTWFSVFTEVESRAGFPNVGRAVFRYLLADDNGVYQLEANPSNPQVMDVQWVLSADDYFWMTGKRLQAASVRRLSASAGNATNQATPPLRQFLIANRFSGEDNPARAFGITYNVGLNPTLGNIGGSSVVQGEVFVVNPRTFNLGLVGATRNAPGAMHGYQPTYLRHGTFTNSLIVNPNASVTWTSPTERVPRVPDPATGFLGDPPNFIRRAIGDPSRATSSSLLVQPSYADRPF